MTMARVIAGKPSAEVFTVSAEMTVQQAVEVLAARRIGAVPVIEGDQLVGIFSERDLIYCAAKEGGGALTRRVRIGRGGTRSSLGSSSLQRCSES